MPRGARRTRPEIKELLMLLLLKFEGPIGRYSLKEMLGLSEREGVVKSMLSVLQRGGYISSGRPGSKLTVKGEKLLEQRLKAQSIVDVKCLSLQSLETGPTSFIVHLRGRAEAIISGMNERDAAVRAGALGATVLTFKNGMLSVPTVYHNLSSKYPDLAKRIYESFSLADGDALIVASAENRWRALEGVLAAAKALT